MDVKIQETKERPQLERQEVNARIEYTGATPDRIKVREELSSELKADPELIIVRKIKPEFGSTEANVNARVYEDEESMTEIEGDYMLERHAVEEKEETEESSEEGEETEESEEDEE